MHYKSFEIKNYRAIGHVIINLDRRMIPLVGVNECGKTTILQAIFCFDSTNDNEQDEKHFKDIKNLYKTDSSVVPTAMANIVTTADEFERAVGKMISAWEAEHDIVMDDTEEAEDLLNEYKSAVAQKKAPITIAMQRNLLTKMYSFANYFDKLPSKLQNELGDALIGYLPYILYNDDFNDRPPNLIAISEIGNYLSGWGAFFNRVFR